MKDIHRLKVRGWRKIFHANGNDQKVEVAKLISDKINFKIKVIKKQKERHYVMIKGSIQEEDITLINICALNRGAPKYIKQVLTDIKGEMDNSTIELGDFNTLLKSKGRSPGQKIRKATEVLNGTIDQLDLIDVYSTLHTPPKTEYTFFSSMHGMFFRIDHTLGHKTILNKFKRIEIISIIFSDHNRMKLEIKHRKKKWEKTNTWRLDNVLLKNQWVIVEIKQEIRKYLKRNESKKTT